MYSKIEENYEGGCQSAAFAYHYAQDDIWNRFTSHMEVHWQQQKRINCLENGFIVRLHKRLPISQRRCHMWHVVRFVGSALEAVKSERFCNSQREFVCTARVLFFVCQHPKGWGVDKQTNKQKQHSYRTYKFPPWGCWQTKNHTLTVHTNFLWEFVCMPGLVLYASVIEITDTVFCSRSVCFVSSA